MTKVLDIICTRPNMCRVKNSSRVSDERSSHCFPVNFPPKELIGLLKCVASKLME